MLGHLSEQPGGSLRYLELSCWGFSPTRVCAKAMLSLLAKFLLILIARNTDRLVSRRKRYDGRAGTTLRTGEIKRPSGAP